MRPAQSGFTLIELLIVISLIIIITGAVVPSFNAYIDNQNVKQAQQALIDDLRTVQNKALNGELAQTELGPASPPDEKVEYWGVEFTQNSANYDTFISVNTSTCGAAGDSRRQEVSTSKILPGGSVVRSDTSCVFISFDNGDITDNLTNSTITVGPNEAAMDVCRRIVVSANGLIQAEVGDGCAP
jgi:prepilin-type N-terminal cleavage/methylation domain-containing protein